MRVFFFSCSCQSAVFFERLGEPWPEHSCYGKRYQTLREIGHSASDAEFNVSIEARRQGRTIPGQVAESMRRDVKAEHARRRSHKKTLYQEVLPEVPMDLPGTVMAIERMINMPKHFGLPSNNRRARQLLGLLGRGRWHRIRVREDHSPDQEIVPELCAFMPAKKVAEHGIREGRRVVVSVEPCCPPGREPVWAVTEATVR